MKLFLILSSFTNILFVLLFINNFKFIYSLPELDALKKFDNNGHYYQRFSVSPNTLTYTEALSNCTQLNVNGTAGYLVTFTSQEEWDWATTNGLTGSGAWIGGTDLSTTGIWRYDGPESGQPMYNLYFDKCYTFCLFGNLEPNLIVNENYLHTSGTAAQPYINNNNPLAKMGSYVCEFGGYDKPLVPTSPTSGSNITITRLNGFNLAQTTINFASRSSNLQSFKCVTQTIIDSSSLICQVPPGQGRYIITIKDNTSKTEIIYWQYELPLIGGINAVVDSGAKATITGANFGTIPSEVTVTVSDLLVPCTNVAITVEHQVLTCTLSQTLSIENKFLPISITVSSNTFISYKAPVFYKNNYYSGFQTWASFDVSNLDYSSKLRNDGQIGHLYSLVDLELRSFLNRTLPKPFNNNRYYFWQNARYEPSSPSKFVYIDGPSAGKDCPLIYSNNATYFASESAKWDSTTRFIIYLDTLELQESAVSGQSAVITEYGGYNPTFSSNTTHSIPTNGGKVDVKIDNYGTVYSVITVTFRSQSISFTRDYINGELDVMIPAGFDGPYEIRVKVDSFETPENTQFIDYAAPNITSITSIPTTGGKVTISGTSFSNTLSNSILNFKDCSGFQLLTNYYSYTCTLPAGSGSIPVSLQVSSKISNIFTFKYESPKISSTNSLPQTGSRLYINGDNFSTNQNKITVTIGSKVCSDVILEENENKINCLAPAQDSTGDYDLIVTVDGLSSDPYKVTYYSSDLSTKQVDADFLILGKDLPEDATIIINDIDISSFCTGSGLQYSCTNLPLTVKSGDIYISKGQNVYPPFPIELVPFISSISTQLLDTVKSTEIIINGRYFETSLEIPIKAKVDNTDYSSPLFNLINSEKATIQINGGFGKNLKLKLVSIYGSSSNVVLFSFQAPEIINVTQDNLSKLITINGLNFSSTDSIVKFGGYNPTITFADSNKIQFQLDNENSRNGYITVEVEDQLSNQVYISIQPILTKITPIPTLKGPTTITITGDLLFTDDYNGDNVDLEFYYSLETGKDIKEKKLNCNQVEKATIFTCELGDGFGYFNLYAISAQFLKSNSIRANYQAPQVLKVLTPVYYQEPTNIQISVNYFVIEYTQVFIESVECTQVVKINDNTIQCYYDASVSDEDKEALKVTVTSANVSGSKNTLIYSTLFDCIDPNCSNNGVCDQKKGKCICEDGWSGLICQINTDNSDSDNNSTVIIPPIIDENGGTEFISDKINFTVSISHLRELNINRKPMKTLKLKDIEWTLKDTSVSNIFYFKGSFKGDSAIFELYVKYFEKETQIEFAGEPIYMPENSIKYEVTISNWNFSSPLNTLQTIYSSKTDKESTYKCDVILSTTTIGTNQFQINTGKGSFASKFSSRVIIDDRIIKSTVLALDNDDELYNNLNSTNKDYYLLTAIETPGFDEKVVLDPLFSQLIKNNGETPEGCENRKWVVPVAVVVSVAGGLSIITAGTVFYRRKLKFSKYMKKVNSTELSNK